jgi:hypothetical protein
MRKKKKKNGKNFKRQKPKVLVLKLDPSWQNSKVNLFLDLTKDKTFWKVGGTI